MAAYPILKAIGIVIAISFTVPSYAQSAPEFLSQSEPKLFSLYQTYPQLVPQLSRYAGSQGFTEPIEKLATVVHELIHIDSAAHLGFFIDGVYYEPYVAQSQWPGITAGEVVATMAANKRDAVTERYVGKNPMNNLGNVVDEINAYSQVIPFVCRYEPQTAYKQVQMLAGFLALQEAFLRLLRSRYFDEYAAFVKNRAAAGAMLLVSERAYKAFYACQTSIQVHREQRDIVARLVMTKKE